jgi:hypothetical protein
MRRVESAGTKRSAKRSFTACLIAAAVLSAFFCFMSSSYREEGMGGGYRRRV